MCRMTIDQCLRPTNSRTPANTTMPPNVWSCRIMSLIGNWTVPRIISVTCHTMKKNHRLKEQSSSA